MRKSPDMFYSFCSIMEGLPGYEYIGRYLRAEVKDVDPTVPFDEKVECVFACTFGVYVHVCVCGWVGGLIATSESILSLVT